MEHQPFETWILTDTPLSSEQDSLLQAHLQTCGGCRTLRQRWQAAQAGVRTAPLAVPRPGFSARFLASLAERRAQQHRLQVRRAFLAAGTGAAVLMVALCVYLLWNASPADWVVSIIMSGLRLFTGLNYLDHAVRSWMQFIPLPIPLAIWILLSTGFAVLVFGWLFTLWRIITQGVKNQ